MQTRVHELLETSFCHIKEDIVNAKSNRVVAICTYHAKLRLIDATPDFFHHRPLQNGIASVIDSVNFRGPDRGDMFYEGHGTEPK